MALVEVGGLAAVEARIVLPRVGAWHVDATLAGADGIAVGDAVEISILGGARTLSGKATRAATFTDTLRVRVVGGAGGLTSTATAKGYRNATTGAVLSDLLITDAGESLDATADAAARAVSLPHWQTFARTIGGEVARLLAVAGVESWRVMIGGGVWCGSEAWADSDVDVEVIDRDPIEGRLMLTSEAPLLLPGVTLYGDRIGDVEHVVTSATVRTVAWVES